MSERVGRQAENAKIVMDYNGHLAVLRSKDRDGLEVPSPPNRGSHVCAVSLIVSLVLM